MASVRDSFIRLCLKPSVECDLPGRLRLRFGRFELLPRAALPYLHYIEDILGMLAGVREVRVNARIGTILILYDAQMTSSAAILHWVDAVVEEGLRMAREHGLLTASITCNPSSPVAAEAEYALEAVVGPEFVTGSTRMKAGTAQKLMLNMLSTAVMIRLGRVEGNRMVNMQLTNDKLVGRGTRMVAEASGLSEAQARALLLQYGSVKKALEHAPKPE